MDGDTINCVNISHYFYNIKVSFAFTSVYKRIWLPLTADIVIDVLRSSGFFQPNDITTFIPQYFLPVIKLAMCRMDSSV